MVTKCPAPLGVQETLTGLLSLCGSPRWLRTLLFEWKGLQFRWEGLAYRHPAARAWLLEKYEHGGPGTGEDEKAGSSEPSIHLFLLQAVATWTLSPLTHHSTCAQNGAEGGSPQPGLYLLHSSTPWA